MSEPALLWSISLLVVLALVFPYYLGFRRRVRRDRARKEEAARLGLDRPLAQFPYVDPQRCIGCGSCVGACPEGDVLGVVGGTATVINALRCIGHAACADACPVGAIEVGLGDLRSRADVPLLDARLESSLPGVFVAGELGGLALIRNAIEQGRRVGLAVAERLEGAGLAPNGVRDVIVVGSGPAGLAAALTAIEEGLRPLVLEQEADLGGTVLHYPRRKLVLVQPVSLPFGGRLEGGEHAKEELLATLEALLARGGPEVRFGERLAGLAQSGDHLLVRTSRGEHRARCVVLALGRRGTPRKLGVPGEGRAKVLYRLLDAESYRDQRVLIVGGGDSAVEAAIGLARQPGNQVTVSYRRERLLRVKQRNLERLEGLSRRGQVRLLMPSTLASIDEGAVRVDTPDGEEAIPNDFVFVLAGGEAPFGLLREAGIRFGGPG